MTLVKKSKRNYEAFLYLRERHYFTPSVHCCYYSCFQLVLAFLEKLYPDDYENFNLKNEIASHKRQIGLFVHYYLNDYDKRNGTKLKRFLFEMKELRIDADYKPSELIEQEVVNKLAADIEQFRRIIRQDVAELFD